MGKKKNKRTATARTLWKTAREAVRECESRQTRGTHRHAGSLIYNYSIYLFGINYTAFMSMGQREPWLRVALSPERYWLGRSVTFSFSCPEPRDRLPLWQSLLIIVVKAITACVVILPVVLFMLPPCPCVWLVGERLQLLSLSRSTSLALSLSLSLSRSLSLYRSLSLIRSLSLSLYLYLSYSLSRSLTLSLSLSLYLYLAPTLYDISLAHHASFSGFSSDLHSLSPFLGLSFVYHYFLWLCSVECFGH